MLLRVYYKRTDGLIAKAQVFGKTSNDLESGKGDKTEGSNGQGVGHVDVGSGLAAGGRGCGSGGGGGGAAGVDGSSAVKGGLHQGKLASGLCNLGSIADGGSTANARSSSTGTVGGEGGLGPVAETVLVGGGLDQGAQHRNADRVVGKDLGEVGVLLRGESGADAVSLEGAEDTLGARVVGERLGADGSDSDGGDEKGLDLHVGS